MDELRYDLYNNKYNNIHHSHARAQVPIELMKSENRNKDL